MKKAIEPVIIEESSGNVFADLGFEKPEEELLKAKLALQLFRILKEKKLTQVKAAKILGVDQPELSKLKNGKYSRFSVERLFGFITLLGHDIDIEIKPTPKRAKASHIEVRAV
jgi:predicted XRE-type DNA-binding protein